MDTGVNIEGEGAWGARFWTPSRVGVMLVGE